MDNMRHRQKNIDKSAFQVYNSQRTDKGVFGSCAQRHLFYVHGAESNVTAKAAPARQEVIYEFA